LDLDCHGKTDLQFQHQLNKSDWRLVISDWWEVNRMKPVKSYQDLEVWQRAVTLVTRVYQFVRKFPSSERFGWVVQIQRAATSVPANIAEGWGRGTTKEFVQFLRVARGSLYELETHLIVANRLGFCDQSTLRELLAETEMIGRMIVALMRTLQKR
jgi:four helix bundle protein